MYIVHSSTQRTTVQRVSGKRFTNTVNIPGGGIHLNNITFSSPPSKLTRTLHAHDAGVCKKNQTPLRLPARFSFHNPMVRETVSCSDPGSFVYSWKPPSSRTLMMMRTAVGVRPRQSVDAYLNAFIHPTQATNPKKRARSKQMNNI